MDNSNISAKSSLKGFWSLFLTQFQGAFNDNAFKFIVIFMVLGKAAADEWAPLIGFVFALPFILFSAFAGQLATRFSKRQVAVWTKYAEVLIMILATIGLFFKSDTMLIIVVFLLSTQSAFFGPSKYGLLPELLPEKRLSWGNGIIQFGTTIAIIIGTVLAGILFVGPDPPIPKSMLKSFLLICKLFIALVTKLSLIWI